MMRRDALPRPCLDEVGMTIHGVRALSDLLRQAGLAGRGGAPTLGPRRPAADPLVTSITHDSRRAAPGSLFVAVKGRQDGSLFASEAVGRGAVAVVASSPDRHVGVPWVVVDDDRAALADLAAAYHGEPSRRVRVAGVTGTNGKTTTTTMVAAILDAAGLPTGLIGTLEARWLGRVRPAARTTPEATDLQALLAEMEADGCRHAAVEISSHAIDLSRVRGLRLQAVGFTNLSQDHLDWHGDMEAYFRSKRRLFFELAPEAPAVVCVDDEHGGRLARELAAAFPTRLLTTCGFASDAALGVRDFESGPRGIRFRLAGTARHTGLLRDVDIAVDMPRLGRHEARNAAVAAGLALLLGARPGDVATALSAYRGIGGRMELVPCEAGEDDGVTVFVDYAHTPAALEVALEAAREACAGRLTCVFGCGGDRDASKREPMGRAVAARADVAIATSDNPRGEDPDAILLAVRKGLEGGRAEVHVERDRRKAIALALEAARRGDVVLVAGKGHETYQEIAGRRLDFDDRKVVRELRRERRRPDREE
jgi:UDP-N-acetylmuramoyl-L-alanyl-D-glutamate--2,6-diaminopimelate ligase